MTTGDLTSFILYSLTGKIHRVYKGNLCFHCHDYVYADLSEQFIHLLSMQLARQSLPCQDYTQL